MALEESKDLIDKELDELYKEAAALSNKGRIIGGYRKAAAYVLKAIAAGSSLLVGLELWPEHSRWFGVAALAAVFADTISSNHKRLLGIVIAGHAAERLRNSVKRNFNRQQNSHLRTLRRLAPNDPAIEVIQDEINNLKEDAHKMLTSNIEDIKKKLIDLDVAALEALSLDPERASSQNNGA